MNFQLFLAVIVAAAIVMASYQYLKWSVIVLLGGLYIVSVTVALFLHIQNDSITWSIPVGDGLFRPGESISILGEYGWLAWIVLMTGGALMIAGAVKRIRMQLPEPVSQVEKKPLTEKEKIEQELDEEIKKVQNALGDPAERGQQDAHDPGGTVPGIHDTEPQGFESDVRERYQTLGRSFVLNTVVRLKAEIEDALRKLSTLKTTLVEKHYEKRASADYRENAEEPDPHRISNLRKDITKAGQEHTEFVKNLNLTLGQHPDWDNPTSLNQLIYLGFLFSIIEFGVSYYFLKDEIGSNSALGVAAVAVVIILILAFLAAFVFAYIRRPMNMVIRTFAGISYVISLIILFLGLGLLLEYRSAQTLEFNIGLAGIVVGYSSMLSNINNLVLFLINLIAYVLFYWKFLLRFERFQGYRRIGKNLSEVEGEWRAMFDSNSASISNALNQASNEAIDNKKMATQAVDDLREKKYVLENIKITIVSAFVQKLHPAYQDDVNVYRTSNKKYRNVQVNPPPVYFTQPAEFLVVGADEELFVKELGIDEFLWCHEEVITQASDTYQKIEDKVTDWHNERAQLNAQWAAEFRRKIDGAEQ